MSTQTLLEFVIKSMALNKICNVKFHVKVLRFAIEIMCAKFPFYDKGPLRILHSKHSSVSSDDTQTLAKIHYNLSEP